MKDLLNGVVIAAALVIAAPAWAQAPATPAAPAAPAAAAPMAPMAPAQRPKRTPTHHVGKSAGDAMTDQLNHEELARIQGAAPPPMPPASSESLYGKSGQPK